MIAFTVAEGRSGRIAVAQVLPQLSIDLVNEALQCSATRDISAIGQWLLQTYSKAN